MSDFGQPPGWGPPPPQAPRPPQPLYPHGYYPPIQESASGMAVASLVLAIISFFICGPLFSVPGAIIGKIEMNNIARGQSSRAGDTIAKVGFYLSVANLAMFALVILLYIAIFGIAIGAAGIGAFTQQRDRPNLSRLERQLDSYMPHSEGPDSRILVTALEAAVQPGDSIAVQIVPGAPRHIVVLIEQGYLHQPPLSRLTASERRAELDSILAVIDEGYYAGGDHLAIALRQSATYYAILVRHPHQQASYDTDTSPDLHEVEAMLAAPPESESIETLAFSSNVSGQFFPLPAHPPRYRISLVTRQTLIVDNTPLNGRVLVCAGEQRLAECNRQAIAPAFDDRTIERGDDETPYVLNAGEYTMMVLPLDCPDPSQLDCAASHATYVLSVR